MSDDRKIWGGSPSAPLASDAGSATPSQRGRAAMDHVANFHFTESNNRKNPAWKRKAHAHAWGGVMAAIGAYDGFGHD